MNDRIYYSREAEMRASRDRAVAVTIFLIFGLGIGALLALLMAPKSGDQTRHALSHALNEGLDDGREQTTSAMRKLEHELGDLRKKVEERLSDLR